MLEINKIRLKISYQTHFTFNQLLILRSDKFDQVKKRCKLEIKCQNTRDWVKVVARNEDGQALSNAIL